MRLSVILVACTVGASAAAQPCLRPAPPAGGHALALDLTVPVTYSDGYQSFGVLIRPSDPPPSCGWPLVVHVHPMGLNRFDEILRLRELAGQGYAVWAYDVRGHGEAALANQSHPHQGTTMWGPTERQDLCEQIQFVASEPTYAGLVDGARVAVIGRSQGGGHAWIAAAWSGLPMAVPGRPATTFPTVRCVVAQDVVVDPIEHWLRGGQWFGTWFVEAISGSYTGVPFDSDFVQQCQTAFHLQDAAGLTAAFAAEGRGIGAMVEASTVPALYWHAHHDIVGNPQSALPHLATAAGPRRAVLGAVGHGVPANAAQLEWRHDLTLRWLNRWLWDVPNEVEVEPPLVLANVPLSAVERDDLASRWSLSPLASLTPPAATTRWFLQDDLTMGEAPPPAGQSALVLQQTIDPQAVTFEPVSYLSVPAVRDVANVLAVCPLDEVVFARTLTGEVDLVQAATVHLRLLPHDAVWQMAVLLTVEPPPGGEETMLASGIVGSRASTPLAAEDHELSLNPVAARLPAGSIVRLRLRNLWLREAPMGRGLEVAPVFGDFRVDIVPGGQPDGCWLDLPLVSPEPRLVVAPVALDLSAPVPITGELRGGAARAGFPYFVAVGASGQVPGTPFLGELIPIDGDWLVVASAGGNGPFYQGFLGFLDANGNAACALDLSTAGPLPQEINGLQLTLAAFVWDGPWAPTGRPSNACDVFLR